MLGKRTQGRRKKGLSSDGPQGSAIGTDRSANRATPMPNSLTPIWILKSINLPRERWTFCQSLFSLLGHAAADDDDDGGREWHGINLVLKTGKKFWEEPPTFKTFMNVRLGGGTYNENTLLRGDNRKSCEKPLVHRAENRVIFHAFKDSFSLSLSFCDCDQVNLWDLLHFNVLK